MTMLVCAGASLQCSFGTTPSTLNVLPQKRVLTQNKPVATIMDYKPFLNISSFGMCTSLANPSVASATAAAAGVLTPMPCLPLITSPWIIGSPTVLIGNTPALNYNSKLICNWGGVIQIIYPGQTNTMVP